MRSIWSGVISFGLVNIPVGMYPATKENQVSFHLLHAKDCGRIKNQRVCSVCGEVLDYDELVKGYEYEKDQYVPVTQEELKGAQSEASDAISIQGFVDLDEIDPIYFDSPYYLTPGKHGGRAYTLLCEVLRKSGKAGIATFVLRTKEYLVALRVKDDALLLNTMHFADEVREPEGIPTPEKKPDASELKMGLQLVESMTGEFDAEKYKDHYNEALLAVIQKKLEGQPVKASKTEKKPTNVLDLMSRLKESLEKSGTGDKADEAEPKTARSRSSAGKASSSGAAKKKAAPKKAAQSASKTTTKSTKASPKKTTGSGKGNSKLKLVA